MSEHLFYIYNDENGHYFKAEGAGLTAYIREAGQFSKQEGERLIGRNHACNLLLIPVSLTYAGLECRKPSRPDDVEAKLKELAAIDRKQPESKSATEAGRPGSVPEGAVGCPSPVRARLTQSHEYLLQELVDTFITGQTKETNPKDQVGVKKVPVHVIPAQVVGETGLALLEGARKYGSYNYRVAGVRASVYYDAAMRHLTAWWEGQDIDPDSNISHITKAIASLVVLRDAMLNDKWVDDRPPRVKNQNWVQDQNAKAAEIIERYPTPKPPFTQKDHGSN